MKTFCNIQVLTLNLVKKKQQQPYFARAVKRPARIFGAGTSQCVVCSIALGCWPWAKEPSTLGRYSGPLNAQEINNCIILS